MMIIFVIQNLNKKLEPDARLPLTPRLPLLQPVQNSQQQWQWPETNTFLKLLTMKSLPTGFYRFMPCHLKNSQPNATVTQQSLRLSTKVLLQLDFQVEETPRNHTTQLSSSTSEHIHVPKAPLVIMIIKRLSTSTHHLHQSVWLMCSLQYSWCPEILIIYSYFLAKVQTTRQLY